MTLAALFLFAYLLGSVPFAVIFGKLKGVDILKAGSGNPGMTNVKRLLGPGWGYACFVLDVAKGLIPAATARVLIKEPIHGLDPELLWFAVGVAAVVGHCASIFLRFKGGKGVSTALGAILGASPVMAVCCFGIFMIVLVSTRYMSIASIVGVTASIPLTLVVPNESLQLLPLLLAISGVVAYRHRRNFDRLKKGMEPKFGFGNSGSKDSTESARRESVSVAADASVKSGGRTW